MRYYEDFTPGDVHDLGSHTFTKDEIVAFAEEYDPQPFHVDEAAAEASMFGGLIASGWHTGSVCMRHLVDNLLSETASLGARGVDEFRWYRPVRPGDTLTVRGEVVRTEPSESDPTRGYMDYKCSMVNEDDEEVLSMTGLLMIQRKDHGH